MISAPRPRRRAPAARRPRVLDLLLRPRERPAHGAPPRCAKLAGITGRHCGCSAPPSGTNATPTKRAGRDLGPARTAGAGPPAHAAEPAATPRTPALGRRGRGRRVPARSSRRSCCCSAPPTRRAGRRSRPGPSTRRPAADPSPPACTRSRCACSRAAGIGSARRSTAARPIPARARYGSIGTPGESYLPAHPDTLRRALGPRQQPRQRRHVHVRRRQRA